MQDSAGGLSDAEVLPWAAGEGRVLITGDKDFGGLLEFGRVHGESKVILLRYVFLERERISAEILCALEHQQAVLSAAGPAVLVLSEGHRRVRGFGPAS